MYQSRILTVYSKKTRSSRKSLSSTYLLTAYGSLWRHVSHRAFTNIRHPARSPAICAASPQVVHPNARLSLSTIRRHVFLGLPTFRLPTGVQLRATRQSSIGLFLNTCPIHLHRFDFTVSDIGPISVSS